MDGGVKYIFANIFYTFFNTSDIYSQIFANTSDIYFQIFLSSSSHLQVVMGAQGSRYDIFWGLVLLYDDNGE